MKRDSVDYCNGFGELSLGNSLPGIMAQLALQSLSSTPNGSNNLDFIVDLTVLAGQAHLAEPAKVGPDTRYDASRASLQREAQSEYDFDGDASPDLALLGHLVTDIDPDTQVETQRFEQLTADQNPEIQGVWLSSRHDLATLDIATTLPDLTRLADWSGDFEDRGLLSQLTSEDLRNTDLFVFRESDGTLVTERHGLKDSEMSDIFLGVDASKGSFYYTIDILGTLEGVMNDFGYTNGGSDTYQQWQLGGQMNPKFYQRRADHLRPGEQVRLIAINRASGYIGSITTQVQAAGSGANHNEISFPIDDIVLGPPNLKIWAERRSTIEQGMTKGTVKEQAIGNEGAGLADDTLITLYSEWLDQNGQPLPEGLDDYGYTGRLAKVIAPNQLAAVSGNDSDGNSLSQFAIKTGRQTQVIRLPEAILGEQHLYVQVSGEPISQNPDFSTSHLAEKGILQHRPDRYVPFKTPVYDEKSSLLQQQAYKAAKAEYEAGNLTTEPEKPEPYYQWAYRPEFQFSIYDLVMAEIRRPDAESDTADLLSLDQPVIASSDQLIDLLYSLSVPEQDPLTPYSYDGDRELIFAIGEQEIKATIGENQQLSFDNLEALASLSAEDFLSIRLYSNNDAGNALWEIGLIAKLSVNRVREADNFCNAAPNRKQFETGHGLILIVTTEPERTNQADVILDGVTGSDKNTRIIVESDGQWIEAQLDKCQLCNRWKVMFGVQNLEEDMLYTLYSYQDENENEAYDDGEFLEKLEYRSGDLQILVASDSSYNRHLSKYLEEIDLWTGTDGVSYMLSRSFILGASDASGHQNLVYRQNEVGTIKDTMRDDYLVNSWTRGAGANMVWSGSGGEKCDAILPVYTHNPGDPLHDLVMESTDFKNGIASIITFKSFERDKSRSSACTDNEENCLEFVTNDLDIDLDYWSVIQRNDDANLFGALGACKYTYSAKVRYKVNFIFPDEYDIKITGEIYDMYDFNYGKTFFGYDFNTDGAVVQLGHEENINPGAVFITSIPFELTSL